MGPPLELLWRGLLRWRQTVRGSPSLPLTENDFGIHGVPPPPRPSLLPPCPRRQDDRNDRLAQRGRCRPRNACTSWPRRGSPRAPPRALSRERERARAGWGGKILRTARGQIGFG